MTFFYVCLFCFVLPLLFLIFCCFPFGGISSLVIRPCYVSLCFLSLINSDRYLSKKKRKKEYLDPPLLLNSPFSIEDSSLIDLGKNLLSFYLRPLSSFSISSQLEDISMGVEWLFTRVYGPFILKNKNVLWEELATIRNSWVGSWMVESDFNVIRFILKKTAISGMNRSTRAFNDFVQNHYLRDCTLKNTNFTWTNGQEIPTMSRLDRFLISNCWEDLYPHFVQEALPKITSDHWPIFMSTSRSNFRLTTFRFENMWALHPTFLECVKEWWNECLAYG